MAVNFLLKRSSTASKRPTAAQLDIGELSLNYDAASPGIFFEDDAGSVRKVGPTEVSATAPNSTPAGQAGNSTGEMWLDTSVTPNSLKIWNGSAWVAASTGSYTESATAPGTPSVGDRWLDTDNGILYTYVDDASGDQWVELGAPGFSPQGSGDVVAASNNAFTGANTFTNTTGQIFRPAATQDGILLRGRAGGTSSYTVELVPTTLSASRTITLANGDTTLQAGTMATTGDTLAQFAATTSSQLAGVISDETGSGVLVFGTSPSFTTSATLANQASARFAEASGNGTNYVGFQAPASIAANLTWTLPATDGTSGQVLQTNGSGVLNWGGSGVLRVTMHASTAVTWLNMPAAATLFTGSTSYIQKADLTNYTECRLLVNKTSTSGSTNSILRLEYATAYTQTAASYIQIGTTALSVAINVTNQYLVSGWHTLVSGAKADVFLTIIGSGGNGVIDPSFGHIVAEFR